MCTSPTLPDRHFVEHFVPQQHQQAAADAMEAAFSMAPDDPLSSEPGEPFDLTLWRGGTSDRNATVVIKVRAYARRLAGGQPVGLLLIHGVARARLRTAPRARSTKTPRSSRAERTPETASGTR